MAKHVTHVDKVYAWLAKGRRTNHILAQAKWGLTRVQYNGVIQTLRARPGVVIDSDMVRVKGASRPIASHQLAR